MQNRQKTPLYHRRIGRVSISKFILDFDVFLKESFVSSRLSIAEPLPVLAASGDEPPNKQVAQQRFRAARNQAKAVTGESPRKKAESAA